MTIGSIADWVAALATVAALIAAIVAYREARRANEIAVEELKFQIEVRPALYFSLGTLLNEENKLCGYELLCINNGTAPAILKDQTREKCKQQTFYTQLRKIDADLNKKLLNEVVVNKNEVVSLFHFDLYSAANKFNSEHFVANFLEKFAGTEHKLAFNIIDEGKYKRLTLEHEVI